MQRTLAAVALTTLAVAQSPGNGISKSTYSCNDPIPAWNWLNKYFPVDTPGDECDNNICSCPASGDVAEWAIQQGRVYAKESSTVSSGGRRLQQAGKGFGMHLVNVTNHLTTGGKSTAEVEAYFASKLGDMTSFDSFMDFSVSFHTSGLASYASAFDADSVPYYATTFQASSDDTAQTYSSLIVHVPNTQLVIELIQSGSLSGVMRPVHVSPLSESRVSKRAFAKINQLTATEGTGTIITPISVNRAVSSTALAKLDDFYVTGMGTTKVSDLTESSSGVTTQCYLWPGAEVDICFTNRPDTATKGSWKVKDFEDMLNTVHNNIIVGHPFCGVDKWEDNHYAIDSQSADTSKIISYVNKNNVPHICQSGGGSSSGTSMHYAFDPTGWGIQLDLGFITAPDDCSSAAQGGLEAKGTYNPACSPGTCKSTQSTIVV